MTTTRVGFSMKRRLGILRFADRCAISDSLPVFHPLSTPIARTLVCAGLFLGSVGCGPTPHRVGSTSEPIGVDVAALRVEAEGGDAKAQVRLARLYLNGQGVTNSYQEAARWFQAAAEQGNSDAQAGLGELYDAGQGVPRNQAKALEYYRRAATNGNAGAQYNLGFIYESGRGVPQNQAEAARWFMKAAQQGDALAQYDLGQRYTLGVGVPTDKVEALKWLILAAQQGQADASGRRDQLRAQLKRDEIAEAERRAKLNQDSAKPQP